MKPSAPRNSSTPVPRNIDAAALEELLATRVTQEPAVVLDEFAPDCVTQLLTTRETAEILDVKPGKLENWRSTKRYPRLRFVKIVEERSLQT